MLLLKAYGGLGVRCGVLNVIGPHNLMGSGTIGRCGFIAMGIALLEEACLYGSGLWGFLCIEYS